MTDTEQAIDQMQMSLGDHIDELRRRLFYAIIGLAVAAVGALACGKWITEFFKFPYVKAMGDAGKEPDLAVLTVTTSITMYLKISLIAAAVVASPWIFYQIWMFVSAGLHPRERRYVTYALPVSAGLFLCGATFFLLVAAIPILKFLIAFSDWMGMKLVITFESYITLVATMILIFGLIFQTPLLVLLLAKMGLVSLEMLRQYRKHVIVCIVILGAMLTPPDPISQISMALPMWILYELGILLVRVLVKTKPS